MAEKTSCLPACRRNEYTPRHLFTSDLTDASRKYESELANATTGGPTRRIVMLNMFYSSNRYVETIQYETYDGSNFFSDVGGTLGLLLGYSARDLYDFLKGSLCLFRRWMEKKS